MDELTLSGFAIGVIGTIATILAALVGWYSQLAVKLIEATVDERRNRAKRQDLYHIPLLRLCYELDGRIGRILSILETDWLKSSYLQAIHEGKGFAKDPREKGYFIMSSIYVFACFFGWTEAIKKGVDTRALGWRSRVFRFWMRLRGKAATEVFIFDKDILIVRRLFQYEELFSKYAVTKKLVNPTDACKLHRHFQHSIGEMMLVREGDAVRCKTFREFYEAYSSDAKFRYWFIPLEQLIINLSEFPADKDVETQVEMKNDVRPLRLIAIRYWCRVLMENLAKPMKLETPASSDILTERSKELMTTISMVTIEDLETHLLMR